MLADPENLPGEEKRIEIAADVISQVKKFKHVRLSLLEAEILARLIDGKRSSLELVIEIFGIPRESPDYIADYYKVRRAVKNLERKGYVSSPLFGKPKPVHLTLHGIASLTQIRGIEESVTRLVTKQDLILYCISFFLAILTVYGSLQPDVLGDMEWVFNLVSAGFLVSIGASLLRLFETLKRVL